MLANEGKSAAFLLAVVVVTLSRLLHKDMVAVGTPFGTRTFRVELDKPFLTLLSLTGTPRATSSGSDVEDVYFDLAVLAENTSVEASQLVPVIRAERVSDEWRISLAAANWSQQSAERVLLYLMTLMESAARDLEQAMGVLALMSEDEALKLYAHANATAATYPHALVQALITEQAKVDPAADAVVFEANSLSYRELERESDRLALTLAAMGADQERPVALALPRSQRLPVVILAALKAGSFFVPLDPTHPRQRLIEILAECQPAVVVVTGETAELFAGSAFPLFRLDQDTGTATDADGPLHAISAGSTDYKSTDDEKIGMDAKAYTIYTSGTTGKPKGVMISQRALVNFVMAAQREPGFRRGDRMLAIATLSFDMSIMDMFLPLVSGGAVVIASEEDARDPGRLSRLLDEEHITCLQATPTTWRMLITHGWTGRKGLRMLSGGEALPRDVANALLEPTTEELKELWNCYGPTETTVYSSFLRMRVEDGPVPIGPPIANTSFYVADAEGKLLPPEVAGELYIGGDGVGLGYFERPELTRDKFITGQWPSDSQQRLFRTGDAARFRADGTLDFFGRLDSQVKLRGYRIELGEVEAVLRTHALVADAAVVLREDAPGDPWLVAYVTKAGELENELDTAELRTHAAQTLPGYMLPARFVVLPTLPLTGSGKTDRRALQEMDAPPERRTPPRGEKPTDVIESALLKVFREVLRLPTYGVNDNFFEHGGYSLLAVRLFARVGKLMGRDLPITTLFDAPTVRELAVLVRADQKLAAVVPVRVRGDRPPFFLVQSYLLYGLAGTMVPPSHPVFGLREADATDIEELPLEDRIATFVDAINRTCPTGPVHLGGWCAAAPLTVEIARSLKRSGRTVGMVALFDAELPGFVQRPESGNPRAARWRAAARYHLGRFRRLGWKERFSYLLERVTQQTMQCVEWVYMRHRKGIARLHRSLSFLPNFIFYNRWTQLRGEEKKDIDPLDVKIWLFRALDVVLVPGSDPAMGWNAVAREGVEVIFVPGHHESMFHEPQLGVLRDRFATAMQGAEGNC